MKVFVRRNFTDVRSGPSYVGELVSSVVDGGTGSVIGVGWSI